METKKVILVTQARVGSTRLPHKVLLTINNEELLKIHLDRLKSSKLVTRIIVATTTNKEDDVICEKCKQWDYDIFRGSQNDVLDRYFQAVRNYLTENDYVVRVTSDCPLIDSALIDKLINFGLNNDLDYCSNVFIEEFPDGQDIEVFKFSALRIAWENAKLQSEREHVTPYIKKKSTFKGGSDFSSDNYNSDYNYSHIRMTVDEFLDFKLIERLINALGTKKSWQEYTEYIIENGLTQLNGHIVRNEGYHKSLQIDLNKN